jgi:hypothetical protein
MNGRMTLFRNTKKTLFRCLNPYYPVVPPGLQTILPMLGVFYQYQLSRFGATAALLGDSECRNPRSLLHLRNTRGHGAEQRAIGILRRIGRLNRCSIQWNQQEVGYHHIHSKPNDTP